MRLLSTTIRILLLLILVSCKLTDNGDEVVINELILLNEEDGLPMEDFKETYVTDKSQRIVQRNRVLDEVTESYIYDGTNTPIKLATIVSFYARSSDVEYEEIFIKDGYPIGTYSAGIFSNDSQKPLKIIEYQEENISGAYTIHNVNDSLLYQTTFSKGTGYWKDFYLNENQLREEGPVENNFKSGIWKYYKQSGEIDSTINYTKEDSVDVRFPYCFLHKL